MSLALLRRPRLRPRLGNAGAVAQYLPVVLAHLPTPITPVVPIAAAHVLSRLPSVGAGMTVLLVLVAVQPTMIGNVVGILATTGGILDLLHRRHEALAIADVVGEDSPRPLATVAVGVAVPAGVLATVRRLSIGCLRRRLSGKFLCLNSLMGRRKGRLIRTPMLMGNFPTYVLRRSAIRLYRLHA